MEAEGMQADPHTLGNLVTHRSKNVWLPHD